MKLFVQIYKWSLVTAVILLLIGGAFMISRCGHQTGRSSEIIYQDHAVMIHCAAPTLDTLSFFNPHGDDLQ